MVVFKKIHFAAILLVFFGLKSGADWRELARSECFSRYYEDKLLNLLNDVGLIEMTIWGAQYSEMRSFINHYSAPSSKKFDSKKFENDFMSGEFEEIVHDLGKKLAKEGYVTEARNSAPGLTEADIKQREKVEKSLILDDALVKMECHLKWVDKQGPELFERDMIVFNIFVDLVGLYLSRGRSLSENTLVKKFGKIHFSEILRLAKENEARKEFTSSSSHIWGVSTLLAIASPEVKQSLEMAQVARLAPTKQERSPEQVSKKDLHCPNDDLLPDPITGLKMQFSPREGVPKYCAQEMQKIKKRNQ